jgi:hypothetical protein
VLDARESSSVLSIDREKHRASKRPLGLRSCLSRSASHRSPQRVFKPTAVTIPAGNPALNITSFMGTVKQ